MRILYTASIRVQLIFNRAECQVEYCNKESILIKNTVDVLSVHWSILNIFQHLVAQEQVDLLTGRSAVHSCLEHVCQSIFGQDIKP